MSQKSLRLLILATGITLVIISVSFSFWVFHLNQIIQTRLNGKLFSPPVEFYSAPDRYYKGQGLRDLEAKLQKLGFHERIGSKTLRKGDYSWVTPSDCEEFLGDQFVSDTEKCLFLYPETESLTVVLIGTDNVIYEVLRGSPLIPFPYLELKPILFAQYYGADPILRTVVDLGDAPPVCLNAILAIEDSQFLEHGGLSVKGILRALWRNLTRARVSQGGSTITQQLVKNYFLSSERTIRRKIQEAVMSILLESQASKDEILEIYINEIYMGQNGTFQVRGFGAAAQHYFNKALTDLNLSECATLAALLNNPGRYNPFTQPEASLQRRDLVLSRMLELKMIGRKEKAAAEKWTLPKAPQRFLSEPAPYFVDAVRRQLQDMEIHLDTGAKIYTTLDLQSQEVAQTLVKTESEALEKRFKNLTELKEKGKRLEAALVSADPLTGFITAVVGGRDFKVSQFNRAIQSQRQVGSIMKPFVYLTALLKKNNGIPEYTPLSLVEDAPFVAEYDRQKWKPENYEKKYFGNVPLFFALKESLNAGTAWLGIQVGLDKVVETSKAAGAKSELKPLPSLALGAFELNPIEVLQMYTTLANLGDYRPLTLIRKVETPDGQTLYEYENEPEARIEKAATSVLIGMMKQVLISGSARAAPLMGFNHPAAGKTGTTNDRKDAWFAGFTPLHAAVVWVGYDDNTRTGLTGASGAVPLWTQYMKSLSSRIPPIDFEWPDNVTKKLIDIETQRSLNIPDNEKKPLEPVELIFESSSL